MRNILRRGEGHPQTVYVRCASCGELVARYVVSGYYHHGKDIDSWVQRYYQGARESGRDVGEEFERVRKDAVREYSEVLEELERLGKDV